MLIYWGFYCLLFKLNFYIVITVIDTKNIQDVVVYNFSHYPISWTFITLKTLFNFYLKWLSFYIIFTVIINYGYNDIVF